MNNEFDKKTNSQTEDVFTLRDNSKTTRGDLITIARRIDEKIQMGYNYSEILNQLNLPFDERIEVVRYLNSIRKNREIEERKSTRHKIKSKKKYEEEIQEEKRNVSLNSLVVGATALASIVCFSVAFGGEPEFERTVGTLLLGMVSSSGSVMSLKSLVESISRKARLEDSYKINYKIDELTKEEKRGRSLWLT